MCGKGRDGDGCRAGEMNWEKKLTRQGNTEQFRFGSEDGLISRKRGGGGGFELKRGRSFIGGTHSRGHKYDSETVLWFGKPTKEKLASRFA